MDILWCSEAEAYSSMSMHRLLMGQSQPPATIGIHGKYLPEQRRSPFFHLSWLLLHGRLNTRDMLNRKRKKNQFYLYHVAHKLMKKHHTISSLIENLDNSIGTGYICKGTEKFLKTGRHVIRKIQFNVVLWERI